MHVLSINDPATTKLYPLSLHDALPIWIVSLLPNTSEMLGALHLQGRVVAVDYYTSYPPDLASLPKVSDVNGKYNVRSEEHTSELQSHSDLVCRLLLEKKKRNARQVVTL